MPLPYRCVMGDPLEELGAWLDANWDPNLSVREWWDRLGMSGWATPHWPADAYGRGLSPFEAAQAARTIHAHGALGAPGGLGLLLAGPTIYTYGTPEQKERYLPGIITGRAGWCQLFSEPVAGSDLAGLQTRAERDGDLWRVTGQKVWTSNGQHADLGMLIARTDHDAPKHRGITYFLIDMHQPGVEVRPLREMTGRALFNEVFLDDALVEDAAVLGGLGNGWKVAKTTLAFERSGLGAGSSGAGSSVAIPGSVAGDLDRRAGDFVRADASEPGISVNCSTLLDLARSNGAAAEPTVRQRLAAMYTEEQLGRYLTMRQKAGEDLPGLGNMAKLRMSDLFREARDLGLEILGAEGLLHDYDGAGRDRFRVTSAALFSPAPPIYGGTDQIQRNILAEQVLGLPREVLDDPATPFSQLRKNA
jgi:alkylation response protein AidB-like acyl-CoA dehydrogenase